MKQLIGGDVRLANTRSAMHLRNADGQKFIICYFYQDFNARLLDNGNNQSKTHVCI